MRKTLLLSILFQVLAVSLWSQSIWNNPINGSDPGASNPFTTGQTFNANLSVSGIGHGNGVGFNTAQNRYNLRNWGPSFDPSDYFEWTLTPNAGFEIDFVSLVFRSQSSGTGPNAYFLRSSLDNYVSTIATFSIPTSASEVGPFTANLSAALFQNIGTPITFRMYAFGGNNAAGTNSINEFTFNGAVAPAVTNTITTTGTYGPFCTNAGSNFNVAYTSVGTFTGTFTAQLSDANGSFASPTNLGTGTVSPIAATLPVGLPAGTGYRIRVVNSTPATTGSDNGTNITIALPPVVSLGNNAAYCVGTPFSQVLNAQNAGATYDWNNGAAGTQTFAATTAGTYTVKVTNGNGCIGRDTLLVIENALPIVNLGNDTAYCAGTAFNLTLNAQNAGAAYNWNSGAATTQTFAANTAGTYSVTVTDANNCENTDQLTVTQNALPVVNLGNDTAFCSGTPFTMTLNAQNAGADFDWDNGAAHTQMYFVALPGTYAVVVTDDNGCESTDQIVISSNTLPTVDLGNDTAYCAGTAFSLTLNAQNTGATYDWNSGSASTQTYTATTAGTYTVTVTDANGCEGNGQLTVTQHALPVVNLGNDDSYCIGNTFSLLLDASNPGATYSWNGGGLTAQIFAVSQAGTYSVTVTNGNGCSASDQVVITENPLPTVDIEDNTFFCSGTAFSLLLNAGNPGATYNWNNGASTAQTFTATGAGTYTVTVTDANGCSNSDFMEITEKPLPVVDLGNDTSYCTGTPFFLLLNAQNPGASYSWNGGIATTQTFTATQAGTYTVNVTDVFGCSQTHTLVITENTLPGLNLGNDITSSNATQILNAGAGFTQYQWFPGGQTTAQITVNQSGTYSVTVSNGNGCTASDTIQVTLVNTSSINEAGEVAHFAVFPNPSSGIVTLQTEETGSYSIRVLSLAGQSVWSRSTSEPTTQIDLSHLPAGVYLLQVNGSHIYTMERVIITR